MAIQLTEGWLAGNFIRRARKAGKCRYCAARRTADTARGRSMSATSYCEGEPDTVSPNPWARDRYSWSAPAPRP